MLLVTTCVHIDAVLLEMAQSINQSINQSITLWTLMSASNYQISVQRPRAASLLIVDRFDK